MKMIKILTIVSLIPSSFVFILFLLWAWGSTNTVFLTEENDPLSIESVRQYAINNSNMSVSEINQKLTLIKVKTAFIVVSGLIGWVSIYISVFYLKRHIKDVPVNLKIGLLAGFLAAIIFPSPFINYLALIPIATVALLLIVWYKNTPNNAFNQDAKQYASIH